MNRAKPFVAAVALAVGASVPALAQTKIDNTMNPSLTPPAVVAPEVTTSTGAPVITTYPADTTVRSTTTTTTTRTTARDEDARERAARVKTEEEEHGGMRNRAKAKKERTREKMGLGHDD